MTPELVAPLVHRFEKVMKAGWGLNMLTLNLPNQGLLVYSPTWLGEGTFEALETLGEVRVIVAPNHFHHLSIKRFRARYPNALVVSAEGALPRLTKQGHDKVLPLSAAEKFLPEGAHFVCPDGTKNGECWLSVRGNDGQTWLVGDAWFHVQRPIQGFMRFFLSITKTGPGLLVGRTYKLLGIRDRDAYLAFTKDALSREKPTAIVPCHGDPIRSEGGVSASERALQSLVERFN